MPAVLDDSVPLPVRPVVVASDRGDRVIAPASGDPFFLGFAAGNYFPPSGEVLDRPCGWLAPTRLDRAHVGVRVPGRS